MKSVDFTKMHGLGNDFMVVNNLSGQVTLEQNQIKLLSDRHTGIGFDQLLMVEKPSHADAEFDYRIFNASGAEVEHCGNGARCFARFVIDQGLTNNHSICVNTTEGLIRLLMQDNGDVTVKMGIPQFAPEKIPFVADRQALLYPLEVSGETLLVGAASIGNPHVLLEVDDVASAEVERLGSLIESHPRFPNKVNVGFMQRINTGHILLRVYERGVGETRACGTGACAAVAIGHHRGELDTRVIVSLTGGNIEIDWPNQSTMIEMTGPCSTVFEGQTRM